MPVSRELMWQRLEQRFASVASQENGNGLQIMPLPEYGLLCAEGVDAASFLQGQLTCDVDALEDGQASAGAHCNAKGRMHSNFLLHKVSGNRFLLQMPSSMVAIALAALSKYAVFSKVTLSDISDDLYGFGVIEGQPPISHPLTALATYIVDQSPVGRVLWLNDEQAGQLLLLEDEQAAVEQAWRDTRFWALANIRAGIALIDEKTSLELIPQMINLDCIGGISFEKGCYTGQEIVARMKYLGKLKRRMHRFSANASNVHTGDSLLDDRGKTIGIIINVVALQNREAAKNHYQWEGLAEVTIQAVKQDTVFLASTDDGPAAALNIKSLPYNFPEEQES